MRSLVTLLLDHVAALRGLALPAARREGVEAVLRTTGGRYVYAPVSLEDDDGAAVIRPADVPAGSPGRWVRLACAAAPAPSGGGTPSDSVVAETSFGASPSPGTASTYARGDHTHGTPPEPAPGGLSQAQVLRLVSLRV